MTDQAPSFLASARRTSGLELIARCEWLIRRGLDGVALTGQQFLCVDTFRDRMINRYGQPDPEWIELRLLDLDDRAERSREALAAEYVHVSDDLPEIRG